jgi:hypothetical protein
MFPHLAAIAAMNAALVTVDEIARTIRPNAVMVNAEKAK